jgi:hypothetical protein
MDQARGRGRDPEVLIIPGFWLVSFLCLIGGRNDENGLLGLFKKIIEFKEVRNPMKKIICLLGVLLMLTLLVPAKQVEAFRGHGGHGWLLPGLVVGGALLGWSLAPRYYYPPPPSAYPPPPPGYPPPPVYYYPPPQEYYSSVEVSKVPPSGSQVFIYPRQGQSQEKQVSDRNECHNWAVSQIGYDPSKAAPSNITESQIAQKSADYYRALGACLDARGYSMR